MYGTAASQKIVGPGEPEVFRACRAKWNAAAEIIVPLVMETQAANGIEPYAASDYEELPCAK